MRQTQIYIVPQSLCCYVFSQKIHVQKIHVQCTSNEVKHGTRLNKSN